MEDGGRRTERGEGEGDGFFWIIISCWEATVLPNRVTIYFRVTIVVWFLTTFFTFSLF
jgi:hypothetical protein